MLWARIVELCLAAGDQLVTRDLAKLTNSSQTSVRRAIEDHQAEWDALASPQVSGGGAT